MIRKRSPFDTEDQSAITQLIAAGAVLFPLGRGRKTPEFGCRWRACEPLTLRQALAHRFMGSWKLTLKDRAILETCGLGLDVGRSGFFVIDFDKVKNPDTNEHDPAAILEWDERLDAVGGPVAETGSGGRHYYFSQPRGIVLSNHPPERGFLRGRVDARGDGGYVVAPGSLIETEHGVRHYRWLRSPDGEIPPPPAWLVAHLAQLARGRGRKPAPRGGAVRGDGPSHEPSFAGAGAGSGMGQGRVFRSLREAKAAFDREWWHSVQRVAQAKSGVPARFAGSAANPFVGRAGALVLSASRLGMYVPCAITADELWVRLVALAQADQEWWSTKGSNKLLADMEIKIRWGMNAGWRVAEPSEEKAG